MDPHDSKFWLLIDAILRAVGGVFTFLGSVLTAGKAGGDSTGDTAVDKARWRHRVAVLLVGASLVVLAVMGLRGCLTSNASPIPPPNAAGGDAKEWRFDVTSLDKSTPVVPRGEMLRLLCDFEPAEAVNDTELLVLVDGKPVTAEDKLAEARQVSIKAPEDPGPHDLAIAVKKDGKCFTWRRTVFVPKRPLLRNGVPGSRGCSVVDKTEIEFRVNEREVALFPLKERLGTGETLLFELEMKQKPGSTPSNENFSLLRLGKYELHFHLDGTVTYWQVFRDHDLQERPKDGPTYLGGSDRLFEPGKYVALRVQISDDGQTIDIVNALRTERCWGTSFSGTAGDSYGVAFGGRAIASRAFDLRVVNPLFVGESPSAGKKKDDKYAPLIQERVQEFKRGS